MPKKIVSKANFAVAVPFLPIDFIRKIMRNILGIDDEKSIARMLYQALTKCGYNVETATGGQEGIKKFIAGQFDLVITNILIPGLNGNDVARPQSYQ